MEENKIEENKEESIMNDKTGEGPKIDSDDLRERKEKIIKFFKENYNIVSYLILAMIVWAAVRIRTSNLSKLKDITTGTWTLGPDLDPFLFLRWAKFIVENGYFFAVDTMRYVPLGYNTRYETLLHPYMIVWFHKIATYFGSESVTHSAVLFPVFIFALTLIAFFFLTRKLFADKLGGKNANIIALIACLFLSVIPIFLPRTIAGIPEKEGTAFLFMFLALLFYISAWKSKEIKIGIIYSILAGASSAGMALSWGGSIFLFLTIAPTVLVAFLLGKFDKNKILIHGLWIASSFALMISFSDRFNLIGLFTQYVHGSSVFVLILAIFHIYIYEPYLYKYFVKGKLGKIPSRAISLIILILLGILGISLFYGPGYLTSQMKGILDNLITPSSTRLLLTVAENRQPFFNEWAGSFGPFLRGFPLFFWIFTIGSVYLFYKTLKSIKKRDRSIIVLSYAIFLFCLIFSRYSSESNFNGTNSISIITYFAGYIIFTATIGYYYYLYEKKDKEALKEIDIGFIVLLSFFIVSIIAARSAVRTIMVLVPSAAIISGYLTIGLIDELKKVKNDTSRMAMWAIVILLVASLGYCAQQYYISVSGEAENYAPSIYTQQWQKAMAWVRENTTEDAVFGHWWDYGYWLQSIGERATVLDGGNAIAYWNHLMGRHALTGTSNKDALEYLYAHNTTHFLIDSTDIGKYTAFSSIGSDVNYDRRSWITTFIRDNNQVQETKNSTVNIYKGGTILDGDIVYVENGTRIFLPGEKAGIGAVLIERDAEGNLTNNPFGIYIYQDKQYRLPLRYAYINNQFVDFGNGVEAGIFVYPLVDQSKIEMDGALLYLSERTVKSQLARLYLYKEDNPYFKLVHSEDDFVVAQIKQQNPEIGDFVSYQGLRGPIRIWEIDYPENITFVEEYIHTDYPEEILY